MFYDSKLMSNNNIGVVWYNAHNCKVKRDNDGLPEICSAISELVDFNRGESKRHLSLRTSAVVVNGATRLHTEELDDLYKDCIKVANDMVLRNSYIRSDVSDHSSASELDTCDFSHQSSVGRERRSSRKRIVPYSSSSNDTEHDLTTKIIETSEVAVQTERSYIANMREKNYYHSRSPNSNDSLPLGIMIALDGRTRIPKKIICSNLNNDIVEQL